MKSFLVPFFGRVRGIGLALMAALALASASIGPALPVAAGLVVPVAAGVGLTMASGDAQATVSFVTSLRNSRCQSIVTAAGASAKLKAYNGSQPSGVSAVTGGNTLLAAGAFGSTIGTCTSGSLDWDEAGFTQTNSTFVAGTPTFIDITTSADVVIMRITICGAAPCWNFTGTIANGQNMTLTSLAFTEGNT